MSCHLDLMVSKRALTSCPHDKNWGSELGRLLTACCGKKKRKQRTIWELATYTPDSWDLRQTFARVLVPSSTCHIHEGRESAPCRLGLGRAANSLSAVRLCARETGEREEHTRSVHLPLYFSILKTQRKSAACLRHLLFQCSKLFFYIFSKWPAGLG